MKAIAAALLISLAAALGACSLPSVTDEINKQEQAAAVDRAKANQAADAFLAANKAKPGVVTTASGLQYEVLRKGASKLPAPGPHDEVTVMYEGALIDGSVFDSSYQRNEPVSFQVDGVIPGWTEALQLMHPGDAFRLVLPADIAYGAQEKPGIPANSVLVFKVELLGFKKADGTVVAPR